MDIFFALLRIGYVVIFFVAVFITLKFEMGEEYKDERGKSIAHRSYGTIFPLLPLGWYLIELYDRHVHHLDYETYKLVIWFLVSGLMILHASIVSVLKRKY